MYNPETEEVEWVKSDRKQRSSTAIDTSVTQKASADAHPLIRWRNKMSGNDMLLEGDLYITKEEGVTKFELHLYCPKCREMIRITSDRKKMDWDGKRISVEPFECPWELNADEKASSNGTFGFNLCKWRVGIDQGIARDA